MITDFATLRFLLLFVNCVGYQNPISRHILDSIFYLSLLGRLVETVLK